MKLWLSYTAIIVGAALSLIPLDAGTPVPPVLIRVVALLLMGWGAYSFVPLVRAREARIKESGKLIETTAAGRGAFYAGMILMFLGGFLATRAFKDGRDLMIIGMWATGVPLGLLLMYLGPRLLKPRRD